MELQNHGLDEQKMVNPELVRIALETGLVSQHDLER